jgi:hypothetical protein
VDTESLLVQESPEQDPSLVRRMYRLPVLASNLPVGTTLLTAVPQYRFDPPQVVPTISVHVEVLSRLSVFPKRVVLRPAEAAEAPKEAKLVVIQRGDGGDITVTPDDESLLKIEVETSGEGRTQAIRLRPTMAFMPGTRTEIAVAARGDLERVAVECAAIAKLP